MSQPKLILASASPRRLDLLSQVGVVPDMVLPADIDEQEHPGELPRHYVKRITLGKIKASLEKPETKDAYVIAADTMVACGRRILPKTEDEEAARMCLDLISARRHRVYGGLALAHPDGKIAYRCVETVVKFKRLSHDEINMYIKSGEWHGKAGGYAIQGLASQFVTFLQGSYSNVVGLSLYDIMQMIKGSGYVVKR